MRSLHDQNLSIEAITTPSALPEPWFLSLWLTLGLTLRLSNRAFEGSEQYDRLTLKDWRMDLRRFQIAVVSWTFVNLRGASLVLYNWRALSLSPVGLEGGVTS